MSEDVDGDKTDREVKGKREKVTAGMFENTGRWEAGC